MSNRQLAFDIPVGNSHSGFYAPYVSLGRLDKTLYFYYFYDILDTIPTNNK